MSNPLPNESRIYQEIEERNLTIPIEIWALLTHHIGNDLQVISLAAEHLLLTPAWIRKLSFSFACFWHRITARPGRAPLETSAVSRHIFERVQNIDTLLKRLKETAAAKGEFDLEEVDSYENGVAG